MTSPAPSLSALENAAEFQPRHIGIDAFDEAHMLSVIGEASRRALIEPHAQDHRSGDPFGGGTVYLCTADGEGNMVSYIQSNFMGFGSFGSATICA